MCVNDMKNTRKKGRGPPLTRAGREAKKHAIEELRPGRTQQGASAIERLRSHEQQLKAANEQLQAHEQQLMAANQRLEAREQQLKAANQQLQAHEQQLTAANQQLEAREQQLRAANQQLQAHEQQLTAANQQLEAREQQLRAANQQLQAHEQQLMAANQQLEAREQQLKAANQKLRTLIDNLPDLIYIKDAQSRFTACNRAVAECMGARTSDELIGKTDFDFYPEEQASVYYADEQKIMLRGQPIINKDEPRTDRSGNERWILTSKLPLRNREGKVIGLVGISRDITERRADKEPPQCYHKHIENAQPVRHRQPRTQATRRFGHYISKQPKVVIAD